MDEFAGFPVREQRGPLDSPLGADLRACEERLAADEADGLEARWEFGRALLRRREGKKLPKGVLAAIVKELGVSRTEIQYRVQFAETFPDREALSNALDNHGSWRRVVRALPKKKTSTPAKQVALMCRRWQTQLADLDPSALSAVDLRELAEVEASIAALRAAVQPSERVSASS
jgi:hypothetical protein